MTPEDSEILVKDSRLTLLTLKKFSRTIIRTYALSWITLTKSDITAFIIKNFVHFEKFVKIVKS